MLRAGLHGAAIPHALLCGFGPVRLSPSPGGSVAHPRDSLPGPARRRRFGAAISNGTEIVDRGSRL